MNRQSGFTIVEIVVVVAVIGILAAVSIVGYTQVQTKATANAALAASNSWLSILKNYKIRYGAYPTNTGLICLSGVDGGTPCIYKNGAAVTALANSTTVLNELRRIGQLPTYKNGPTVTTGSITVQGIMLQGTSQLIVGAPSNTTCPAGSTKNGPAPDTICQFPL